MLRFPVAGNRGMIVGNPEFVGWIVMTVGEINKLNRLDAAIPQSMPGRQRMCLKTCVIGRFRSSK